MVLVEVCQAVIEENRRIQVIWKGEIDCALDRANVRPERRAIIIMGYDPLLAP